MTFDTHAWLNEEITVNDPYEAPEKMPRHQRLCYLMTANGGPDVRSWGFLGSNKGHPTGLEQNQALELIAFSSYMRGLDDGGVPEIWQDFDPYVKAYLAKIEADWEAHQKDTAALAAAAGKVTP